MGHYVSHSCLADLNLLAVPCSQVLILLQTFIVQNSEQASFRMGTTAKCSSAFNAVAESGDPSQRSETLTNVCRPQEANLGEQPRSVRQHRAQVDSPARADSPGYQRVRQRDAWRHQQPASALTRYLCHILCHLLIGPFRNLPARTHSVSYRVFSSAGCDWRSLKFNTHWHYYRRFLSWSRGGIFWSFAPKPEA